MADWWLSGGINPANCVAAYQAIGAESYAASLVNLANPGTYDATKYNNPTWNKATGWHSIQSGNHWFLTGYTPTGRTTTIIRYANWTAVWWRYFYGGGSTNLRMVDGASNLRAYNYDAANDAVAVTVNSADVIAISGTNVYTLTQSGTTNKSTTINPQPISIGGLGTTAGSGATLDILAFAIYDTVLTAEQVAALQTAMMALGNEPEPQTNIPVFMAHYRRLRSQ